MGLKWGHNHTYMTRKVHTAGIEPHHLTETWRGLRTPRERLRIKPEVRGGIRKVFWRRRKEEAPLFPDTGALTVGCESYLVQHNEFAGDR